MLDNNDFKVNIAGGITIDAAKLGGQKDKRGWIDVPLGPFATAIPGVRIAEIKFKPPWSSKSTRGAMLKLKSSVSIPHVQAQPFAITVNAKGKPSFKLKPLQTTLSVFNDPKIDIALNDAQQLSATIKIDAKNLTPEPLRKVMKVEAGGQITLANGKLSGEVEATKLEYGALAEGSAKMAFDEAGRLSGSGSFKMKAGFLQGVAGSFSIDNTGEGDQPAGKLAGELSANAADFKHGIQGLELTAGRALVKFEDGKPSGGLEGLALSYAGLGKASVTATIDKKADFTGKGDFEVGIPEIADVKGDWVFKMGRISGSVIIGKDKFPEALPVKRGALTAKMDETGKVSFSGQVAVSLGPAGDAQLRGSYTEDGKVNLGMTADLNITGLQQATFTVDYINGDFRGEAEIATDAALLAGISGKATVIYEKGLWSGTSTIAYDADNGKLKGQITVNVAQTEQGTLQMSGKGDVTAQLMPSLQGTLNATIHPDGVIDVSGEIVVTDPVKLFDEKKFDRELFKYSQNIPLWAILVAVIRVRAGIRAGIGPGVFRDITITGSYSIGNEGEPSFAISGELFIPAYLETYVAFSAGLGLDVVLGSLTGGIEGVATAGIYGSISVIPELSYENSDYRIEGTATLAAGARLKVGLNAWAEVEALWITVWENSWKLAEWTWNVGPDLALQAKMDYTFGKPEAPTLEFKTSDIDTESMIRDALPKDGVKPSGAKEALKNKAEWKGALKKPKPPAPLPAELDQKAAAKTAAPEPKKKKPPKKPGPDKSAAKAEDKKAGAGKDPKEAAAAGAPEDKPDPTVQAKDAPPKAGPRYPGPITLKTLDEGSAPTPRTMEDKKEDVKAAAKAVDAVSKSVGDSDALDDRFPAIKRRFGLTSIGYKGDFNSGFKVAVSINPVDEVGVAEELKGPLVLLGRGSGILRTKVHFTPGSIATPGGTQKSGLKMDADPLGPDHVEGTEAKTSALKKAFAPGRLPTQSGDARQNYVRGHLLGFRLGGPGDKEENLFPITQHANSLHQANMEAHVREWVNKKSNWVKYTVEIESDRKLEQIGTTDRYKIDSVIKTRAAVLTTDMKDVSGKSREFNVPSNYRTADTKELHDAATVNQVSGEELGKNAALPKARPEDNALKILGDPDPKPSATYVLGPVYEEITTKLQQGKTMQQIMDKVKGVPGIGKTTVELIPLFYKIASQNGGKDADIGEDLNGKGPLRSFTFLTTNSKVLAAIKST